ncbi:aspartyl-phosphate phosphatase Spo0E family protein [Gorillibacterium sp. CAU 1737]|uniref:aspartyl-phosphate phosphatase Spo0E family protein n=1 Tax=Gorillibacterium sp. CAU 1737 TaxID=3140362 RepID=UPI003260837E
MSTILDQIEEARREMIELANCYGIDDSRVLEKSNEVDGLLNQYERTRGKNGNAEKRGQLCWRLRPHLWKG